MAVMPSRIANAIRSRRSIRHADFCDRCIRLGEIDSGFVNFGIS